jgi:hypothetical protein
MPLFLLDPRLWIAVALAAAGFAGGWSLNKMLTDRKIAGLELRYAETVGEWQKKVAEAESKARAREAELQTTVDATRETANEALSKIAEKDRAIVRLRVDRDRLHNDLAAFAAASGSQDTVAACQSRAGRLADLLGEGAGIVLEGVELARAGAVAADERAVKLTACMTAWPR